MRMCSVGDSVVDRYAPGTTMYPGGGAANIAVHSARFGARASYLGVIGSDAAGRHVAAALRAEGVDLTRARFADEPHAVTEVRLEPSGDRTFLSYQPPATTIELDDDDRAFLVGSDWLYTNYSSGVEDDVPALAAIAPLAFDFSYKDLDYAGPLLPHVGIAAFSRSGDTLGACEELVRAALQRGPRIVIVTRGEAGAVIGSSDDHVIQPAEEFEPVDTLGAGDAFLARFVNGWLSGEDVRVASREASLWAARTCAHRGAFGHASITEEIA